MTSPDHFRRRAYASDGRDARFSQLKDNSHVDDDSPTVFSNSRGMGFRKGDNPAVRPPGRAARPGPGDRGLAPGPGGVGQHPGGVSDVPRVAGLQPVEPNGNGVVGHEWDLPRTDLGSLPRAGPAVVGTRGIIRRKGLKFRMPAAESCQSGRPPADDPITARPAPPGHLGGRDMRFLTLAAPAVALHPSAGRPRPIPAVPRDRGRSPGPRDGTPPVAMPPGMRSQFRARSPPPARRCRSASADLRSVLPPVVLPATPAVIPPDGAPASSQWVPEERTGSAQGRPCPSA